MAGMSAFFALAMPEDGFKPARMAGSSQWTTMTNTLSGGLRLVRGSTVLLTILGVELFWGGGSEGFDRLWEAHLVRDVGLPRYGSLAPVAWFALVAIVGAAMSFAVNWYLEPRIDRFTSDTRLMTRGLGVLNLGYVSGHRGVCSVRQLRPGLALSPTAFRHPDTELCAARPLAEPKHHG